jgi:hypothetical protein
LPDRSLEIRKSPAGQYQTGLYEIVVKSLEIV